MKTESKELTVIDRAAVALNASAVEKQIGELLEKSKGITVITNAAGRDECHAAAMATVKARTSISKDGAAARADATAYSKAVIAEEKRLLGLIEPEEARLRNLRDEWDAKIEAEKAAKAKAEAERQAAIQQHIDDLRNIPARSVTNSSKVIGIDIEDLQNTELPESLFGDRLAEAVYIKDQSITQLKAMLEGKKAQEELQAQQEAARLESERVAREIAAQKAAEEKAQREAMAAQMAELAKQKDEMDQRARELAEAEAKVKAAQDAILAAERAKMEAELIEKVAAHTERMANDARLVAIEEQRRAAEERKAVIEMTPVDNLEERRKQAQIAESAAMKSAPTILKPSDGRIIEAVMHRFNCSHALASDWILECAKNMRNEK